MHLGRQGWCRRHALTDDMTSDEERRVFGRHMYDGAGIVGRRALLCVRLGLVFHLHLAIARIEEREKPYEGCFTVLYLVRRLVGVYDVAVRLKASYAQGDAPAHDDRVAETSTPEKRSGACIRPALATVSVKHTERLATPLN